MPLLNESPPFKEAIDIFKYIVTMTETRKIREPSKWIEGRDYIKLQRTFGAGIRSEAIEQSKKSLWRKIAEETIKMYEEVLQSP